jgi:FkbM family methyltransferase
MSESGAVPETFVSWAQNGEDVVLARALRPDVHSGFFIDVGAGHPETDSVTRAFSLRGWTGINIEPLPEEFALITAARPDDINLNIAIGTVAGTARLFAGPPESRGLSTMNHEFADRYLDKGQAFEPINVEVRTLADVVDEHARRTVDFLKVDVEGFEGEVLASADLRTFRPRIIVVEATLPESTELSHQSWEPLLLDAGYVFTLFDGLNRFYARSDEPELAARLSAPANVTDSFVTIESVRAAERAKRAETYALSLVDQAERTKVDMQIAQDRIHELEVDLHELRGSV